MLVFIRLPTWFSRLLRRTVCAADVSWVSRNTQTVVLACLLFARVLTGFNLCLMCKWITIYIQRLQFFKLTGTFIAFKNWLAHAGVLWSDSAATFNSHFPTISEQIWKYSSLLHKLQFADILSFELCYTRLVTKFMMSKCVNCGCPSKKKQKMKYQELRTQNKQQKKWLIIEWNFEMNTEHNILYHRWWQSSPNGDLTVRVKAVDKTVFPLKGSDFQPHQRQIP